MSVHVGYLPALTTNEISVNTEKLNWSTLTKEELLAVYAHADKPQSNIRLLSSYVTIQRDPVLEYKLNNKIYKSAVPFICIEMSHEGQEVDK